MHTYKVTGKYSYSGAETESGCADVKLDELVAVEEMDCRATLDKVLESLETQEEFRLATCDAETGGKKGATFKSCFADSENTIDVDIAS